MFVLPITKRWGAIVHIHYAPIGMFSQERGPVSGPASALLEMDCMGAL